MTRAGALEAPDPAGPDELRRRTLLRVIERLLQLRQVFGPVLIVFALWIAASDDASWRRMAIFAVTAALGVFVTHDFVLTFRRRRGHPGKGWVLPKLGAIVLMQHLLIFLSGGMTSPVLPLILPVAFLAGLVGPPRLAWSLALGLHLPVLWIEAGVQLGGLVELTPTALAGDSAPAPALIVLLAAAMSLGVLITTVMSNAASTALTQSIGEALHSRDAALASRAAQTRALTTLTGEIAHELKNPLASVKGLAALVGRELERSDQLGKSAERMQVLRREVDRMQVILEEFLNFSRPLVPLDQRALELRELVDHVVDLHEGMAGERRVSVSAEGRARVRCDPRKIEQVLINLTQNALEAAPPGSSVALVIRRVDADSVAVDVRDAGPGLDDALRERVFEAGVTGSSEGSGLGLTIARALARQHGGELELGERSDGQRGCEATLSLPSAGLDAPAPAPAPQA